MVGAKAARSWALKGLQGEAFEKSQVCAMQVQPPSLELHGWIWLGYVRDALALLLTFLPTRSL